MPIGVQNLTNPLNPNYFLGYHNNVEFNSVENIAPFYYYERLLGPSYNGATTTTSDWTVYMDKYSSNEENKEEESVGNDSLVYVGAIVSLKSGGPVMTVDSISSGSYRIAFCLWFEKQGENYIKKEEKFNVSSLKLVDEQGKDLIPKDPKSNLGLEV